MEAGLAGFYSLAIAGTADISGAREAERRAPRGPAAVVIAWYPRNLLL